MPTGMPGNTMRGFAIQQIERVINKTTDIDGLIGDLSNQSKPMIRILRDLYGGQRALDKTKDPDKWNIRHLRIDWFGRHKRSNGDAIDPKDWRGRWWRGTTRRPGYQPIDPVVRMGFWTTCVLKRHYESLQSEKVPVQVLWICAGHHFETHIVRQKTMVDDGSGGEKEVVHSLTTIIVTPHEGMPVEDAGMSETGVEVGPDVDESIWIVRQKLADPEAVGYKAAPHVEGVNVPAYDAEIYNPLVSDPID